MVYDNSIERIIAPPLECLPFIEEVRKESAAQKTLTALSTSDPMIQAILATGKDNFINSGGYSRVYVLDSLRVIKFCWDLPSLKIMERLGTQSRYFPRVDLVLEAQARDGNVIYHAAIVERLHEGYPVWMRSLIDGYRHPFRADTPFFANGRLLQMSSMILAGNIVVPPAEVQDLAAAMRLLAKECLENGCLADLRTEFNIMIRPGGQAVIADPTHPIIRNS